MAYYERSPRSEQQQQRSCSGNQLPEPGFERKTYSLLDRQCSSGNPARDQYARPGCRFYYYHRSRPRLVCMGCQYIEPDCRYLLLLHYCRRQNCDPHDDSSTVTRKGFTERSPGTTCSGAFFIPVVSEISSSYSDTISFIW